MFHELLGVCVLSWCSIYMVEGCLVLQCSMNCWVSVCYIGVVFMWWKVVMIVMSCCHSNSEDI